MLGTFVLSLLITLGCFGFIAILVGVILFILNKVKDEICQTAAIGLFGFFFCWLFSFVLLVLKGM